MMLRAMAVCAILAVALAPPEIAGEDDEETINSDDEGPSGSSEDEGATTVDLSGEQQEEDKTMFIVEGGGKRCPGCGTVDQEYSVDTNTTVCMTCYQQFANSLDANSTQIDELRKKVTKAKQRQRQMANQGVRNKKA